jgi:hypothetical protein
MNDHVLALIAIGRAPDLIRDLVADHRDRDLSFLADLNASAYRCERQAD